MRVIVAMALGLCLAAGASAQEIALPSVMLSPTNIVPQPNTAATATANFSLNPSTRQLTWQLIVSGLNSTPLGIDLALVGPVGIAPSINLVPTGYSELQGSLTLSPTDVAQLEAGRYAITLHTAAYPAGELRGFIMP